VTVAIKLSDRGSALFRQTRVGEDGRPFAVYKFRTMVVDAEARKAELVLHNETGDVLFKMRKDPRIRRVGQLLRRWSLDELPQLFNVIRGDMSLVGPRPPLPDEVAKYPDHVQRRFAVKPGITGLWQVNGRSDLSWDESVRLGLHTWRTGRSCSTCRFSGRPCRQSWAAPELTSAGQSASGAERPAAPTQALRVSTPVLVPYRCPPGAIQSGKAARE
jgi:lipopolysaccharide/colanic/teichoic acid biosynthesis glycosyltransferase